MKQPVAFAIGHPFESLRAFPQAGEPQQPARVPTPAVTVASAHITAVQDSESASSDSDARPGRDV